MRAIEFLTEDYRTELRIDDTLINLCRTQYLNYFTDHRTPAIYRGCSPKGKVSVVNPKYSHRHSVNTTNEYTLLVSNLPVWSAYPRRDQSIICSTSRFTASAYGGGGPHAVVLPDTFTLGVCPSDDFWDSFHVVKTKTNAKDMQAFNVALREVFGMEGIGLLDHPVDGLRTLKRFADSYAARSGLRDYNSYSSTLLDEYLRAGLGDNPTGDGVLYRLGELLDPRSNYFKLFRNRQDLKGMPKNAEVWTSDACLLVRKDTYSSLRDAVLAG